MDSWGWRLLEESSCKQKNTSRTPVFSGRNSKSSRVPMIEDGSGQPTLRVG